jgi:hypothetical protein
MDSQTFSYYERSKSKDPNAPTVIVLDEFRSALVPVAPGMSLAHGNISLLGAQNSGYSTIGVEFNDQSFQYKGYSNYAEPLNQIDADIRSGKLKGIGKGDVLNISLVDPPVSFEDTSKSLGMTVTPENLASQKDAILARMTALAHDHHQPKVIRDRARSIVDTNNALDRLRADGLTVVHSAGNTEQTTFSLDFMNAEVQLSSNKPSGQPDTFSVSNSLTEKGDGVLPIVFHPEMDLLDPAPLDHQKGSLEIVGTGIVLRNISTASFIDNTKIFNREQFDIDKPLPNIKPTTPLLTAEMLLPHMTVPHTFPLSSWQDIGNAPTSSAFGNIDIGTTYKMHPTIPGRAAGLKAGEMKVVGTISGTSFANIGYLHEHCADFKQKKGEATFGKIWNWNETLAPFNKNDKQ